MDLTILQCYLCTLPAGRFLRNEPQKVPNSTCHSHSIITIEFFIKFERTLEGRYCSIYILAIFLANLRIHFTTADTTMSVKPTFTRGNDRPVDQMRQPPHVLHHCRRCMHLRPTNAVQIWTFFLSLLVAFIFLAMGYWIYVLIELAKQLLGNSAGHPQS
jgi:hypothetical protein